MVEINSSQDVRDCMNATMPCRCEFHVEAMIASARDGGGTKESAAWGIGFRRARGQARDVCSKQFQLTCWNWNRTRTRSPGRLLDATALRTWAFLRPSVALPHFSSSNFAVTLCVQISCPTKSRNVPRKSIVKERYCFLTYFSKHSRNLEIYSWVSHGD